MTRKGPDGSDNARWRHLSSGNASEDGGFATATELKKPVESCSARSGKPSGKTPLARNARNSRSSESHQGPASSTGSARLQERPRHSIEHRVAPVLRKAILLLLAHGWRAPHWTSKEKKGLTIYEAIQLAGDAKPECYYAKLVLAAVLGFNASQWEDNRWRTEQEVLALMRRGAECAEGRAYRPRSRTGPKISTGPWKREELPPSVIPMRKGGAR